MGAPSAGKTIFGTAPTAVNIVLQSAMTTWTHSTPPSTPSTATGGKARTVTDVRGNFLRAKVTSITGGRGITVQILG